MIIVLLQTGELNRNELLYALRRGIVERDTGLSMGGLTALLAVVLLAGMILRAVSVWRRSGERRPVHHPIRLFHDLLKTVELTPGQRRFLHQLVKDAHVANPAALLISPRLFDATVKHWIAQRKSQQHAPDASAIQHVRAKLFS